MHFKMNIPGLKGVEITKIEELGDRIALYVQLPKCPHKCPSCKQKTTKVTITVCKRLSI